MRVTFRLYEERMESTFGSSRFFFKEHLYNELEAENSQKIKEL